MPRPFETACLPTFAFKSISWSEGSLPQLLGLTRGFPEGHSRNLNGCLLILLSLVSDKALSSLVASSCSLSLLFFELLLCIYQGTDVWGVLGTSATLVLRMARFRHRQHQPPENSSTKPLDHSSSCSSSSPSRLHLPAPHPPHDLCSGSVSSGPPPSPNLQTEVSYGQS